MAATPQMVKDHCNRMCIIDITWINWALHMSLVGYIWLDKQLAVGKWKY